MGLDWGSVPAWVGSILTGSSILIASLTYRRSVQDRRDEQLNRARAQAAKVSAWVNRGDIKVFLQNANDTAVKARVFFEERLDDEESAYLEEHVGPNQRKSSRTPSWLDVDEPITPALLIVDGVGAVWLRHSNGKLDRLNEEDRASLERKLDSTINDHFWVRE
jgi:hypothetical protein